MSRTWTFGQKLALGFALIVTLAIFMAIVAVNALNRVVASKDRVIAVSARNLIDAAKLEAASSRKAAAIRGYLLSGDPLYLQAEGDARRNFLEGIAEMKPLLYTDRGRELLRQIEQMELDHQALVDRANTMRQEKPPSYEAMARFMTGEVMPMRNRLDSRIDEFAAWEQQLLDEGRRASSDAASSATHLVIGMTVLVILLGAAVAIFLTRLLARQIGSAVQDIQSSSSELQTAATQQSTGVREQTTAMTEITTTINELLATSRQIAESAQRVAQISSETGDAAAAGDKVVEHAHESVSGIKRQVDTIVNHMLDLGRKSQQIGVIVDIINELAEQTNILAINATIEAAGAGENGKRFAVVADEIRKLADRVGGSIKDIRSLVEEIRAAVNATVMATEGGTKAVDAGAREFNEVASSLHRITTLVITTSEAAREIELSTKQQSTAVEQVNSAVANVTQVSKEVETSMSQALQTASQLAALSRNLSRLIRPQADGTH
jgi:CHASE3 domain sensor protein